MTAGWPLQRLSMESLIQLVRLDQITPPVLLFGYRTGVLSSQQAVDVELLRLNAGLPLSASEVEIALRLSDDLDGIDKLLEAESDEADIDFARRVWTYVGVTLLREHWGTVREPMLELAALVEELGEVAQYSTFVYHHPLKIFRRRFGKKDFLEALDDQLRADGAALGPNGA